MNGRFKRKLSPLVIVERQSPELQQPEMPGSPNQLMLGSDVSFLHKKASSLNEEQTLIKRPTSSNFFKAFMVRQNVKKFVQGLRKFQTQVKGLPYSKLHFAIINDKANGDQRNMRFKHLVNMQDMPKANKKQSCGKRIRRQTQQYRRSLRWVQQRQCMHFLEQMFHRTLKRVRVFDPDSNRKIAWDCLIFIINTVFILLIPIEACVYGGIFFVAPMSIFWGMCLLLQYLDLLINLNTAQFVNGELVQRRSEIFAHQISQGIQWKIISLIVFVSFYFQGSHPYDIDYKKLSLFIFYYYLRQWYTFKEKFESLMRIDNIQKYVFEIFKLLLTLTFINHVFSCLWVLIAKISIRNDLDNWLVAIQVELKGPAMQYVDAMYYTHVTMTSVGYGDISPKSIKSFRIPVDPYEKIFCIFFLLTSTVALSYGIGTVGSIISQLFAFKDQEIHKIRIINQYMWKNNFDMKFQNRYTLITEQRIREYLKYIWKCRENESTEQEIAIIADLSQELRVSMKNEININILTRCEFLRANFSKDFIHQLAYFVDFQTVIHENNVDFGDAHDPWLMFVENGIIQAYVESTEGGILCKGTVIDNFKNGDFLGIEDFVLGTFQTLKYQSLGFTKIYYIKRSHFLETIKNFTDDNERFHCILDEIKIYQDYSALKVPCRSCFGSMHPLRLCHYLHYQADNERTIKCYQFPQTNRTRNKFQRNQDRSRHQFHSLIDIKECDHHAQLLVNEFPELQQIYSDPDPLIDNSMDLKHTVNRHDKRHSDHVIHVRHTHRTSERHIDTHTHQTIQTMQQFKQQHGVGGIVPFDGYTSQSDHEHENETESVVAEHQQMNLNSPDYWLKQVTSKFELRDLVESMLGPHEVSKMEMLFLALSHHAEVESFESLHDYVIYAPQNNPSLQIRLANQALMLQRQRHEMTQMITREKRRMGTYLMHPNVFLDKYRPYKLLMARTTDFEKSEESPNPKPILRKKTSQIQPRRTRNRQLSADQ